MTLRMPVAQGPDVVDTVVMRLIPPEPSWFAQVAGVASGILGIVACVLLLLAIVVALRQRKAVAEHRGSVAALSRDLAELLAAANRIAQEVAAISASVRQDVAALHETVHYTNRRARRAVAALADRVDVFTDTVAVVQDEAQEVIVNGLAAVRGVRAGVRALVRGTTAPTASDQSDDEEAPRARPRTRDHADDAPPRPHLRRRRRVD